MSEPRVVVLGGGPAGDVAAFRSAQLGASVTMIERDNLGGTCLNWGCIPTKALLAATDVLRKAREAEKWGLVIPEVGIDFPKMMERKNEIVGTLRGQVEGVASAKGVTVISGEGHVEGDEVVVGDERFPYDLLFVAVGTSPAGLPMLDMEHPAILTSDDILQLEAVPESMLVLGGGVIGCEFASLFAPLGSEVTVVEILPQLLTGVDKRTATQFQRILEKDGVTVHLDVSLEEITEYRDDGITARLADGTEISAEKLLVSIGRRSAGSSIGLESAGVEVTDRGFVVVDEFLQSANSKIYAVGDCIGGLQLAHLAEAEAHRAVENALGPHRMPIDRTVVPSCIYTHPEIASVGLNADAAKEAGYDVKRGQARYGGDGKALAEGDDSGVVQLVFDGESHLLLGATLMGTHAVEMIAEIGVAISAGLTIGELGEIIHPHPTISELIMHAAQQGDGVAPYLSP